MKKLLLILMALFLWAGSSWAQLNEGFEGTTFPPNEWTVYNLGDANAWVRYTSGMRTGIACASIGYTAAAHNDWLVTPKLVPNAGNFTYSFWAKNGSTSWIDLFDVKLSTTGNAVGDFTVTLASNIGPGTTYTQYSYDLTSYIGQNVYIAIIATSTDMLRLYVDDVTGPPIFSAPVVPNCAANVSPVNGGTNVPVTTVLNWASGGGAPTGYKLYFGDTPSPAYIGDLGALTTYDPTGDLNYSTTYYWQVIAYNGFGDATGCSIWSFTTEAFEMKVPYTGNNSYTTCSGHLYDHGGSLGDYSTYANGYTVLYPSVSGNLIQISGTTAGESCCDYVSIYNGVGTSGTILGTYYMGTAVPTLTSSDATGALTVLFYSDVSANGAGIDISISCVAPPTCIAPTGLSHSNYTLMGADLQWSSVDSFFDIFIQATGLPAPGPATSPTEDDYNSGYSYTWAGGAAGLTYDWYVRTDCAAGGGTGQSDWVAGTPFTTLLCNPVDQCSYTFRMTDSYGDTWNGNTMAVIQGGVTVQTLSHTASGTAPVDVLVGLCDGLPFELFWNAGGSYPLEVGIEILDAFGTSIYYKAPGTGAQNTSLFTGTVNCTPPQFVDWCNIQWPASGTIPNGGNFTVYSQVWEDGITNVVGPGAGIDAWIGFSTSNTNPNTWTNWVPAVFNVDAGNNDEYMLDLGLAIGAPGIYYYASRYELNDAAAYKYGAYSPGGGGFWDGTTYVSGMLTIECDIYTIPYSQNFDGVTAPAMPSCFLVENVNADANFWKTTSTYRLSAPNSAYMNYNSTLAMDDWMYLPGLQLTGGKTYEISFAYASSTSFPEKLAIYWGDAPSSSAMVNGPIFDEEFAGGYYLGLGSFTPASDGVYYIGFWGHSDVDEFWLSVDDILVTEAVADLTWNGSINNSWHNAGNWIEGMVPASTTNVTIPAGLTNYPTITSAATCNSLYMGSGSSILDNGLLIIINTTTGLTIERIIGCNYSHSYSPSVSGATSGIFHLPGSTGLDVYLYSHSEVNNGNSTSGYFNITPLNVPLVPMAGYAVYPDGANATPPVSSWTFIQQGGLNTGLFGSTNNLTRTGAGAFAGFNYIGNPYASSLDWTAATGWTKTNVNSTIWVENSGNWASYTAPGPGINGGSNIVAPGQGFFVEVTNSYATGTVTMTNLVRIHTTTPYLKDVVSNYIKLAANGNNKTDETVIRFETNATSLYDGQFDGAKLEAGDESYPQIYSVADRNLAYNALPETEMVQLGFHSGLNGEYQISATEIADISHVWLEDTFTNTFTNLTSNNYNFVYNVTDEANRFVLHFTPLAVTENPTDLINIYSSQKDVYVSVPANTKGDIVVYNLMGQEVAHTMITGVLNKITVEKSAYYLVKVMSNESVVTKKVFVK